MNDFGDVLDDIERLQPQKYPSDTPPIVEKLARMICENFGGNPDTISYSPVTEKATAQWETFVSLVWDIFEEIEPEFYGLLHGTHIVVPDPDLIDGP